MVTVKICGITDIEDARVAWEAGADALGLVLYRASQRYVSPETARGIVSSLPPFVTVVGLFVDEPLEAVKNITGFVGFDVIQLHGNEPPEYCLSLGRRVIKAFRVKETDENSAEGPETVLNRLPDYSVSAYLLDTYHPGLPGGTGTTFNWDLAIKAGLAGENRRIILAGGLTPDNVAAAVKTVRPYGVDVSSGVEEQPGKKDRFKVREFIRQAKGFERT